MKIVVTGPTGLIGRRVVARLLEEHQVFACSRTRAADMPGVTWCEVDLSAPLDERALPAEIDAVIHLAQSSQHRSFPDGAVDMCRVNVTSTVELMDYARRAGARTFVLASSGGVCGLKSGTIQEDDPYAPGDFYTLSKVMAEQATRAFQAHFTTVVLRYFMVFGEHQRDKVIPNVMQRIGAGQTVTLAGPGGLRTNPTFVDEAADITVDALGLRDHATVHVAGGETVNFRELCELIGGFMGRAPVFAEAPPGLDLVPDLARRKELFPDAAPFPLAEGLKRTIQAG